MKFLHLISKDEEWIEDIALEKHSNDAFDNIILTTSGSTSFHMKYVKLDLSNALFGTHSIFLILIGYISLLCILQGVYYILVSNLNRPVVMIGDTYLMYNEAWSGFFTLHATFFNVLFWNNSSPFWEMEALQAYEKQKIHVREQIIDNISRTLDYDLGNYTETYRDALSKVSIYLI